MGKSVGFTLPRGGTAFPKNLKRDFWKMWKYGVLGEQNTNVQLLK